MCIICVFLGSFEIRLLHAVQCADFFDIYHFIINKITIILNNLCYFNYILYNSC